MTDEHELYTIARKLRYDLTAMQAKVTDLLNALGRADLPKTETTKCPKCGAGFKGPLSLAEHEHVSHDGPIPEHWLQIEARSIEPELEAT